VPFGAVEADALYKCKVKLAWYANDTHPRNIAKLGLELYRDKHFIASRYVSCRRFSIIVRILASSLASLSGYPLDLHRVQASAGEAWLRAAIIQHLTK
jgi:hypothetical protein